MICKIYKIDHSEECYITLMLDFAIFTYESGYIQYDLRTKIIQVTLQFS